MTLEYLRNYSHLRFRTNTFGSIFRIKSGISHGTHLFFKDNGFLHLDPNIITMNECEGGAGVFQITEKDISLPNKLPLLENKYDWSQDHFGTPVYLTVSSQLQLEALACSLGSVYTTNKSFRSEHSSTAKHLSEFTHLEIETCFIELGDLMSIGEQYIKYIAKYLLDIGTDPLHDNEEGHDLLHIVKEQYSDLSKELLQLQRDYEVVSVKVMVPTQLKELSNRNDELEGFFLLIYNLYNRFAIFIINQF
jgi:asparaginyl-tRNA synthetase